LVGVLLLSLVSVGGADARPETASVLYRHWDHSTPDWVYSLRTMLPDGSNDTWLAEDAPQVGHDWSPDGSRIVLPGGGEAALIMRCDGSAPVIVPIPAGGPPLGPKWSPDGRRILFYTFLNRKRPHVFVFDTVTQILTDLSVAMGGDRLSDEHPDWSPDGTRIVFDSTRDEELWARAPDDPAGGAITRDLHIMTADGAHIENLTQSVDSECNPSWSPDGRSVAFDRRTPEAGPPVLYVLDLLTRREQRLTGDDMWAQYASWSPDGGRIVFSAMGPKAMDKGSDVYVIDSDGGNLTQLTQYEWESGMYPRWLGPGLAVSPARKLPAMWGQLKW